MRRLARWLFRAVELASAGAVVASAAGCGGAPVSISSRPSTADAPRPTPASAGLPRSATLTAAVNEPALALPAPSPAQHWYFEWLSEDGKRALLRRLDGDARATLQTRVVDVDSGATVDEETFPELARIPFVTVGSSVGATIGRRVVESSELEGMLAGPAFNDDLVRGARLASAFPFGSCGRLSASPSGTSIAFNAGDWLYLADKAGQVKRRLVPDAAYDPRFTPDGKYLIFRRANGTVDKRARYELFAARADLSVPAQLIAGTAGARDRFVVAEDGKTALAVASQEPHVKTCVLSIALRPPFAAKRLVCLEGGEPIVESILSPHGRWAVITTQNKAKKGPTAFRVRAVSVASGNVVLDEPALPGLIPRAVSDTGILVQSGTMGVVVDDLEENKRRAIERDLELGHRGFFRSPTELVVLRGATVGVIDLAKQ